MEDNEIDFDNFSKLCRICLLSDSPLTLIPEDLSNLFKTITDIEIKKDDDLPQKLCHKCIKQLREVGAFIEKSRDNHALLVLALQRKTNEYLDNSPVEFIRLEFIKTESDDETHDEPDNPTRGCVKNKFSCHDCESAFALKKYLLRHTRWHCKALKYKCESCDMKFKTEQDLQSHSVVHGDTSNSFDCHICGKGFNNANAKLQHQRSEHKYFVNDKFSCGKCDRVVTSLGALTIHMRTHTGEKPFSCSFCDKKFAYLSSLTIHTRSHTGETPFSCENCKKSYKSLASLKRHQHRAHFDIESGDKPKTKKEETMECKICHKMLNQHGFGTHMRVHSIEKKKIVCEVCNKEFKKNSHLIRHVRIHTGERPYACVYCDRTFMQDTDLKRHVAQHTGERRFQCQHCGKRFFCNAALSGHMRTHEPKKKEKPVKRHLCTVCGKSFGYLGSLVVHNRLHTGGDSLFHCSSCEKKYVTATLLRRHVAKNHTEENVHVCVICQKHFYDGFDLKRHLDKVHATLAIKKEALETENSNT